MMQSYIFEFISGPDNFEIIQQKNDFAEIKIEGIFKEDLADDTEQNMPFSLDKTYARIINETDCVPKTGFIPFETENNMSRVVFENVPCGGPYLAEIVYLDKENCVEYPIRGDNADVFCW